MIDKPDDRDPPIQPLDFLGGVKVVDIGDIRVARGLTRRPSSACKHHRLHYDSTERRIWCADCEQTVEAFDAFANLVGVWHSAKANHDKREERITAAEAHSLISLASKELDKAWRSRGIPACPHCSEPLFPEDFKHGVKATYGREYAEAMRRRREASP